MGEYLKTRGQHSQVSSCLPPWVLEIKLRSSNLCSKCLYPQIHLTGKVRVYLKLSIALKVVSCLVDGFSLEAV